MYCVTEPWSLHIFRHSVGIYYIEKGPGRVRLRVRPLTATLLQHDPRPTWAYRAQAGDL